jgi:hypothetical protein
VHLIKEAVHRFAFKARISYFKVLTIAWSLGKALRLAWIGHAQGKATLKQIQVQDWFRKSLNYISWVIQGALIQLVQFEQT